ncbi:hypothetical protein E4665_07975 [Sporolactobacillus shoreae]|uniref:SH3 domain-containing protein n=1 Tax=Sporolactobacillus shoreae TaxID=1465501 RepID=A0A4Z0GQU7_9BACL|nr:SH3 domain-containing protein [Sporolactobacillus shoreae]TGA98453.1 hypothetical protein E4665_07975 [Sporolactobacillus shoreae]
MPRYTVIENYQSCYPDPIVLKRGEEVLYGEEDTQYPNWIFCQSLKSKKEGWVPKQILSSPNHLAHAKVLDDYSAHELTVTKGERLHGLKHLNDWTYCRTGSGKQGWIPSDHIAPIFNQ